MLDACFNYFIISLEDVLEVMVVKVVVQEVLKFSVQ